MALQPSDAIIRVRDITVQFGKNRILDGLNLDVKRGEILGFVGPSGAGKSTISRLLFRLCDVSGEQHELPHDSCRGQGVERVELRRRVDPALVIVHRGHLRHLDRLTLMTPGEAGR